MKVMVVGSGGREHTLIWKIKQSPLVREIYCAPGNAGISKEATCVPIPVEDIQGLLNFALNRGIDLTVVGPEAPLVSGIVDTFTEKGLKIFGPSQKASQLEGSKVFAKEIMNKYGIPTARSEVFTNSSLALSYIHKIGVPIVVKAEGLAAGKGVVVAHTQTEATQAVQNIMERKLFGEAGNRMVIEEYLEGEEVSVMSLTDSKDVRLLASAQDYKRVFDGDRGPNTGGMGAYSPAPVLTTYLTRRVKKEIFIPLIKGLNEEGIVYKGVIYAGLMITKTGPKVLEFNARFGDPECQVVILRLKNDLIPLLLATLEGSLNQIRLRWSTNHALCVVLSSGGYPESFEKGKTINGLEIAESLTGVKIFHSGTTLIGKKIVSSGGRVLGITGMGSTLKTAFVRAYSGVKAVSFEKAHYRKDIGYRAFKT
ncbi:MAG: Phosphoribosylamine--glycine ligase [candidate division WS2 bacterium]|uniref:Phosphoribosylamine--glycine ligase n=1 Tax=Psychracetigena formicireducens TaxID=2986056 RepID=A0A9E2BH93_PSYF1|nr:Phosphoribosylamine--glycine ligase [Candidatus Psychracetigena formicireducens]MBT9145523.1 Phosphoribosylamine--glycine ligase [Candidatus Psychracetigena formicireducens]